MYLMIILYSLILLKESIIDRNLTNIQHQSIQRRMSQLSLNRKRNSHVSNIRSRIITDCHVPEEEKQNFNIDQNIDENLSSIKDTIVMLKQYEKLCIDKEDYLMAEETKNKIEFLQKQEKSIQKQRGVLKQQQNMENICKQGEEEVQSFQAYWDGKIKQLIEELKDIEGNFVKQQEIDLQEYKEKIATEEGPKIKYSSKVLELRKNLTNLIKMRKYKQADEVKNKLKLLQAECEQSWGAKSEDRLKTLVEKFQKKQSSELKALRIKLQAVFNEKIKQRDEKFQILLKRNRKRQIESSKSKVNMMKESSFSRSRSYSRVVLGNSKMSVINDNKK